jgi:WD40-like Beta Propeller Repeat
VKEAKDKKTNVRVYESFPIRSWDRWVEPEKQLHLMVQAVDPAAKARDLLAATRLVAEARFGGTGFGGETGESIELAWSKDGRSIVFAVTTERNAAAYSETAKDIYRVDTGGGEPTRIAHGAGAYGSPKFSADGKTLCAKFNPNNGRPYNNERLVAFD